jgi:hypothetical protein
MLSKEIKEGLIRSRQQGLSIPEISRLHLVPKSTVLRWVKDVRILPKYHARWLERRNASKIISKKNWELATTRADTLIKRIDDHMLALVAATLYWAEGSKKDFSISNTDPVMIKTFLNILRKVFSVKDDDIKVSLRIYEDLDKKACLKFWSEITKVTLDERTSINVLKGSKRGKLKYGMCRVRVRKGGLLLKEFFAIINRVDKLMS